MTGTRSASIDTRAGGLPRDRQADHEDGAPLTGALNLGNAEGRTAQQEQDVARGSPSEPRGFWKLASG